MFLHQDEWQVGPKQIAEVDQKQTKSKMTVDNHNDPLQ